MKAISHRKTSQHVRPLAMALLLSAATFGSVGLHAQSCAVPFLWQPDTVHPNFDGTTCGGPHVADSLCEGFFGNPGPNFVVQFYLFPSTTQITLVGGGQPGFDPAIFLSNSLDGCSGGPCLASGDAATPMQVGDLPSGTYFLTVAAAGFDAQDSCGNFQLSMNGDFSGGDDAIFSDGFDGFVIP
ncbi:MAG: hypothetical protein ABIS07_12470 [Dokdonella sp.]